MNAPPPYASTGAHEVIALRDAARATREGALQAIARLPLCPDLDQLVALACDAIRDDLGYAHVGLWLVDALHQTLGERQGTGASDAAVGLSGDVALLSGDEGHARLLADPRLRADGAGFLYLGETPGTAPSDGWRRVEGGDPSLLVALRAPSGVLGLLAVGAPHGGRPLTPQDAPPLVAFATALALAMENAMLRAERAPPRDAPSLDTSLQRRVRALTRARAELDRRVGELEWLRDIGQRINAAASLDAVLDVVYDGIRAGLGYDRVGLHLLDRARGVYEECRGTDARGRPFRPELRPSLPLTDDSPIWQVPDLAALLRGAEY